MMEGFKNFLMRGNVVDLAVGVIIGGAFGKIVDSMVKDIITPIIGLVGGQPDFSAIRIAAKINEKTGIAEGGIAIGNFINAIVGFIILALVVYFVIVVPMSKMTKPPAPAAPAVPTEQELLTEIRDLLARR
jgi:large conductance mechanosensitive channel